jgi:hypothetical protein
MFLHSLTARLRSCLSCGSRAIATLLPFYVRSLTSLPCASVYSLCFLTDEGLSQVGVAARENTEPVRDLFIQTVATSFRNLSSSQVVWARPLPSTTRSNVLCFVCFGNFLTKLNTFAGKITDTTTAKQVTHVNSDAHNRQ